METPQPNFVKLFRFDSDGSKPGRTMRTAKIGDIYMSVLEIEPGVTTGNYYHKNTRIMFYASGAPVKAIFEHVQTGERKEVVLKSREHAVHVPEYVAIATQNVGDAPAVLVLFSNKPLRSEDDTYDYELL